MNDRPVQPSGFMSEDNARRIEELMNTLQDEDKFEGRVTIEAHVGYVQIVIHESKIDIILNTPEETFGFLSAIMSMACKVWPDNPDIIDYLSGE